MVVLFACDDKLLMSLAIALTHFCPPRLLCVQAKTDTEPRLGFDPENRPEVANLLGLYVNVRHVVVLKDEEPVAYCIQVFMVVRMW